MLRKTLTITALSCLALAANADSQQNYGNSKSDHWSRPWLNHRIPGSNNPPPTQRDLFGSRNGSLEALEIPLITLSENNFRVQIKVANDNGKSILNVLDILDEGVNIYCTNIDFDRRLLTLDNRTEHATADFNMKELDEYCDQATPSGHVHIKCKFDGQRRFDLTSNYREVMQGRTTTGQQKVSQVSASCSVAVSGAGEPFTDLEGELTQSWTD